MKRQDLIADMKKKTESSFITRKDLAAFMGLKDAKSVDRYLVGLPTLNKRFFINDVADRMLAEVTFREDRHD